LIENAERLARIDLDLSDFEKEHTINDYGDQNDPSHCMGIGHCTNERRVRKRDKKVRRDVI